MTYRTHVEGRRSEQQRKFLRAMKRALVREIRRSAEAHARKAQVTEMGTAMAVLAESVSGGR